MQRRGKRWSTPLSPSSMLAWLLLHPNCPVSSETGGPPLATARSSSAVAWLWAINVDEGSRFRIRLVGPGDVPLIDHTTNALPRRKANYLAYVGRKTGVKSGAYHLTAEITNGEKAVVSKVRSFTVSE